MYTVYIYFDLEMTKNNKRIGILLHRVFISFKAFVYLIVLPRVAFRLAQLLIIRLKQCLSIDVCKHGILHMGVLTNVFNNGYQYKMCILHTA